MRFLRYSAGGTTSLGILEGEVIAEISGDLFGQWQRTGRHHTLAAVTIEVPLVPPTFYAAGLNYVAHVKEVAEARGEVPKFPPQADIGYRTMCLATRSAMMCPSGPGSVGTGRSFGRRIPIPGSRWGRGSRPSLISMPR